MGQDSSDDAVITMYGPWVQWDWGAYAPAALLTNPIPGSTISFLSSKDNYGRGEIDMEVTTTMATPPGWYTVGIQVTDLASHVSHTADIDVEVSPCVPEAQAQVCSSTLATTCGTRSVGCEQTVDCGSCPSGSACQSGICCPDGQTSNGTFCETPCTPHACTPPAQWSDVICDCATCHTPAQCCALAGGYWDGKFCS
jgi:hypothetical protein